jgi:hypothetical protein
VPYQGQIPGIGGDYSGDFTAGADLGLPGQLDPTQGGTLTVELPPGTYPTPGGGTVTQPTPYQDTITPPDADIPPVTFPPVGQPYTEPGDLTGNPGQMLPVPPPGPTDVLPPMSPPGFDPSPDAPTGLDSPPAPGYSDVITGPNPNTGGYYATDPGIFGPYQYPGGAYRRGRRGQRRRGTSDIPPNAYGTSPYGFTPGAVYGHKIQRRIPRYPAPAFPPLFPRPFPSEPKPEPRPDDDETGRERPPLFPPDEEPANDTSIRRPPEQQVEPVRIPDPAGVRAPFPQPPTLPRVPPTPTVSVPTPEVPTWPPVTPATTFPSASTSTPRQTIPAPVPTAAPPNTTFPAAPKPIRVTFPNAPPLWQLIVAPIAALLGAGLRTGRVSLPSSSPSSTPAPAPISPAIPISSPITIPISTPISIPSPVAVPIPVPVAAQAPLTSVNPASLQSASIGQSCETPSQQRQRRQRQRESCERFITVIIPRHKRRVCVSEAARIAKRKLVRYVGKEAGKLTKAGLKKIGLPSVRLPRRPRVRRSIELPGGFGIEIPKPGVRP